MAIKSIEIFGYRSISHLSMQLDNITTLIGRNGSGKSNILSALNFFYRNLTEEYIEEGIFDASNSLRNEICIKVIFDLKQILKIMQHNQKQKISKYETYYQKIYAISADDEIIVQLIKRKTKPVEWNINYNVRQIIAAVFPLYFIDARKIMLTDWTNLWNLIGDFVKLRNDDSQMIREGIQEMVEAKDSTTIGKLKKLESILKNNQINVRNLTSKQLGKILAEIALGGQIFQYDDRNLKEYSNGTNAYNYTNIMISILEAMRQYRLKEPIIILDEPEISLHQVMVDKLMENIFQRSGKIQFVLSTHSARCMKKLFEREVQDNYIYHVALIEKYTKAVKVKNLSEKEFRERVIVTEAYTNSCFAKMVVSVEGATELEVLKNKYLIQIFPFLKEVEFVTGRSNEVIHNLASPGNRNYQVPILSVMDMDKVLKKGKKNQICFKGLKEIQTDQEVYWYGKKRKETLQLRRRIMAISEKCSFTYQYPLYSCYDRNFRCMLELIRKYYDNYEVFLWSNTIEGALITIRNSHTFVRFAEKIIKEQDWEKIKVYLKKFEREPNISLNYLRMIFSGKSDFLLTKKQIKKENPRIDKQLWDTLSKVKKTGNWVSKWLEFFFLDCAGIDTSDEEGFRKFCIWQQKDENYEKIIKKMKIEFDEVYFLIKKIEMTLA